MKILFLTNMDNDAADEDRYLVKNLSEHFEIVVSHPLKCGQYLPSVAGIIIRNIWPTHEYRKEWTDISNHILDLRIPTYNPLTGKGDTQGKNYLVDLYKANFPVIPSIDEVADLNELPESELYWIKPKYSCDGVGAKKISKQAILKSALRDYIIQPYVDFKSEPSFYFIDNQFSYAVAMPNRLDDKDLKFYEPTEKDLDFAQGFVNWNRLPYGIQRVDAVRTKNGELLLTEIEDLAGYLYLLEIDVKNRKRITSQLVDSIKLHLEDTLDWHETLPSQHTG